MDDEVMAAVVTAINAYIHEEAAEIEAAEEEELNENNNDISRSDISPWRLFGRQRGVITRTNWRVSKTNR
jgi:hypothetical protein